MTFFQAETLTPLMFDFVFPTTGGLTFSDLNGKSLTCAIVHLPMLNFSDGGIRAWLAHAP